MSRENYLAEALGLYLEAPDTPSRASRRDWAIAADLYRRGVRLEELAHAIRLATLRRRVNSPDRPSDQIHSLAYYRTVLLRLGDDDLHPHYVDYIRQKHDGLRITDTAENPKPRLRSQNPALSRSR